MKVHTFSMVLLNASNKWDGQSSRFYKGEENSIIVSFVIPDGSGLSTVTRTNGNIENTLVDDVELFVIIPEVK